MGEGRREGGTEGGGGCIEEKRERERDGGKERKRRGRDRLRGAGREGWQDGAGERENGSESE